MVILLGELTVRDQFSRMGSAPARDPIKKPKLGYVTMPIAATPSPLIARENSNRKWIYEGSCCRRRILMGLCLKPYISGRNPQIKSPTAIEILLQLEIGRRSCRLITRVAK